MNKPKRYRKKPVEIQAMQWDGTAEGAGPIIDWVLTGPSTATYHCEDCERGIHVLLIRTLEGTMQANAGDWIIRGVRGEFYPCKPDIFVATYDWITRGRNL
jgi:hypothetical protein